MYVDEEKFRALPEVVAGIKVQLDLYQNGENAREKEFRELEREVFRLKISSGSCYPNSIERRDRGGRETPKPIEAMPKYESDDYKDDNRVGIAWLR